MAVPNTTTFSLQEVVNEVNPTTDDLVDCFADAISEYFDGTYSGSKNSLLNFRNYGPKLVASSILLNSSNIPTKIYEHNHTGNTSTLITISGITQASADIAHTANKLWLFQGNLSEWDITLNPFNATYNRTISGIDQFSSGLCAIDDTTLINVSGASPTPDGLTVFEVIVTGATAVNIPKFNLIPGRYISGDFMLTTTNKFIVTTRSQYMPFPTYIEQYSWPDGAVELDLSISAYTDSPYGLYQYNDEIFIVNGNGVIYKIDKTSPYAITPSASTTTNISIVNGASQLPSALTVHFDASDTEAPTQPSQPSATSIAATTFTLSWAATTDNIAVTGYKIYKNGSLYVDAGNVLTYNITGQIGGATNSWQVSAYDAASNESTKSTARSVTQQYYPIYINSTGQSTANAACIAAHTTLRWCSAELIADDELIYTSADGSSTLSGLDKWYSDGNYDFQVMTVPIRGTIYNRTPSTC